MLKLTSFLAKVLGRAPPPTSEVDTVGHLDLVASGKAWGWAFYPSAPTQRVLLRLVIDDVDVAEGFADLYRGDLHEKGFGDGSCGFAFLLPAEKLDGREHCVDVISVLTGHRLLSQMRTYRLDPDGMKRRVTDLLFDAVLYEKKAGPVADALDHYRKVGWRRGLNPYPLFDVKRYVRLQGLGPDVEPLAHFQAVGQYEGASVHALFDMPPTTNADGGSEHSIFAYLERTAPRGLAPSPFFSDREYGDFDLGVEQAGFLPLVHYLSYGWYEGRRPHADFDPKLFGRLAGVDEDVEPYGFFVDWLKERLPTSRSLAPLVSIVVLNLDKAILTLQCLYFLERHTDQCVVEIILVDNGSGDEDFAQLCRYARGIEIVRVGANRGFGEGSNIGAEHARGAYVVFLNNDVFVTEGWLQPLLDVIEVDATIGAVGPKFVYPDGRLQEAGATISSCGTAVQRGKNLDPRLPLFNRTEPVDYCSAALLLVRIEAFRAVLGFDLCWDPAYYEDTDLCLKLREIGLKTVYAHRSEVVHLENATSSGMRTLQNVVAVNRLKFVGRWAQSKLSNFRRDPEVVGNLHPPVECEGSSLSLYSPYPLTPGGGERYLLTIAAGFGQGRRCVLFTPDRYSRVRLLTMARELGINLDHVELGLIAEAGRHERFDTFVCMGNEVLPSIGGLGVRNVFHCQFPFPMEPGHHGPRWQNLESYDLVVVNSAFTAAHYGVGLERLGLAPKPIVVVPPPVPQIGQPEPGRHKASPIRILNVGRFAPGGHCKRQDMIIDAFRLLSGMVAVPIELHLAGAVGADHAAREYLEGLIEVARDLSVLIHPNPSAAQIAELYADATLYWHLTGIGQNIATKPELYEHFGIAIAEAMSAGVVPLALRGAGPSEIITDGKDGVLVNDVADLVKQSATLLADNKALTMIGNAAVHRAAAFKPELFDIRFAAAVAPGGRKRFALVDTH